MGHDYRPDYSKLGKIKENFPHVPMIAVTATAIDRVRKDTCDIIKLSSHHKLFRSSAKRDNLKYQIRPKSDKKEEVVGDIAAFIKEKHKGAAGIVYTLSKKNADTVAKELCERGIRAAPYHSDRTPLQKQQVQSSWMRNSTQVVVATIAFGLGINKPDVRFVIHHTVSKSIENYYQESGRAGRDGKDSDCVLYYSPKDVGTLASMASETQNGLQQLWPMIRYCQEDGDDALCKATILRNLNEVSVEDFEKTKKAFYDGDHMKERVDISDAARAIVKFVAGKTNP
ncbi:hypothetical protein TeGR_g8744, partial [Tetraparma gracilis]